MRRRFLIEWTLMAALLPLALIWLSDMPGLREADQSVYDRLLALQKPVPSKDILIIGIDDRSIRELGPWPWPHSVHVGLLEQLVAHAPRSVFMDMFFDRPDALPQDDTWLAQAMGKLPMYLPLRYHPAAGEESVDQGTFVAPLPELAHRVRGLGHVKVAPDQDGVIRKLYRFEGPADALKPYAGLQLATGGATAPPPTQAIAPAPPASSSPQTADNWVQSSPFGMAIAGPAGTYRTVSYISVLHGEVPDELLRARDLLVGPVSGVDIGDRWLVAGLGPVQPLPGVEIHANAMDALREGRAITPVSGVFRAAWIALPIILALALFLRLSRYALTGGVLTASGVLAVSAASLTYGHLWLPPSAAMAGIGAAYMLWSWRRLDALFAFFRHRIEALNAIPAGAFELQESQDVPALDALEQQTLALDHAIGRLTSLQNMLSRGFWRMPVATLVCQENGQIRQSNAAARELLFPAGTGKPSFFQADPLNGVSLEVMLALMSRADLPGRDPNTPPGQHWTQRVVAEYTTPQGRVFSLRIAALGSQASSTQAGWSVVLRELTSERKAEQERTQWLNFLSHDLRSPQVNIISLLGLYAGNPSPAAQAALATGVRREAERTLALAEGFMDLSEAESGEYHFAEVIGGSLVLDAVDRVWPYAEAQGVNIVTHLGDDDCVLRADSALLTRAIINLLNNAIRHSPQDGRLYICMAADEGRAVLTIADEGEGIDLKQLLRILDPGDSPAVPRAPVEPLDPESFPGAGRGRGIGLSVVQAVISKHEAWMDAWSMPGAGATFLISLPLLSSLPLPTPSSSGPSPCHDLPPAAPHLADDDTFTTTAST